MNDTAVNWSALNADNKLQTLFISQILAHLVIEAGGQIRVSKQVIRDLMASRSEGFIYFDIDGDDIIAAAVDINGGFKAP